MNTVIDIRFVISYKSAYGLRCMYVINIFRSDSTNFSYTSTSPLDLRGLFCGGLLLIITAVGIYLSCKM
jgi:hypothetical protein